MITSDELLEAYEAFLTEGGGNASNEKISEVMGIDSETIYAFVNDLSTERILALLQLSGPEAFMVGVGVGVKVQRSQPGEES